MGTGSFRIRRGLLYHNAAILSTVIFKGSVYCCVVKRVIPKFVSLSYKGKNHFTFVDEKQDNGEYRIHISNIDNEITAEKLHEIVISVYTELKALDETADFRIKNIESTLEKLWKIEDMLDEMRPYCKKG